MYLILILQNHRITECSGLERTAVGHRLNRNTVRFFSSFRLVQKELVIFH